MPKEDADKTTIKHSPGFFREGFVFEQVQGLKYAQGETNNLLEEYIIGDVHYTPLRRPSWKLATAPIEYNDPDKLYDDIRAFIVDHLFLPSEELYDVLTAWVIATWVPETWTVVPYIFFCGPLSSGKTRGLEVLERLVYRGILSANFSTAALFRIIEDCHPVTLLDETDIYTQDTRTEIISLLNSGYRRGQFVHRVKKTEAGMELEVFDVFGFKAFAGTVSFVPTLESRSITIHMLKAEVPVKRHIDEERALELRNRLLGFRLYQLACVKDVNHMSLFPEVQPLPFGDGRLDELFYCLLAVANKGQENILKHAKEMAEIRRLQEEASIEAEIVRLLMGEDLEIVEGVVLTKDLREAFNEGRPEREKWKTSSIGRIMDRLGFVNVHKSHANGWRINESRLKSLALRYDVDATLGKGSEGSQPSQENNSLSVGSKVMTSEKEGTAPNANSEGAQQSANQLKKLREMMEKHEL